MLTAMLVGCGQDNGETTAETSANTETQAADPADEVTDEVTDEFKGMELSILVSTGWMDNRYDVTIDRFEETYGVTVDLQTIPADQYSDVMQSRLTTDTMSDIFWIQSNPFAIESVIVDPEKYCIDFSDAQWKSVMPESRLSSCMYDDKLYGLQLWHNSPEYVMLYNKTLFEELGIDVPRTYDELLAACEKIAAEDITPWLVPGADGWQHQLAFFQIGGVYEQAQPGLYDALNNNEATFAGNETMLLVLEQFKELSDLGYFGEDWIGTDSTNLVNEYADRNCAMAMANSSFIKQIQDETDTTDDYGLFLIPLADNETFPTNPAGPTMFGYAGSENPELVKLFFDFVTTTQSLQEILDNSPQYTNLDVTDTSVVQNWLPEEEEFMDSIDTSLMQTPVLQTGTKYTNDYWMEFGADLIAYCTGQIEVDAVLENMDINRAEAAKTANDPAWE